MTDLPRPNVSVDSDMTTDDNGRKHINVEIKRENRSKSYHGTGMMPGEVVKDVVEQIINDSFSAEWLPGKTK